MSVMSRMRWSAGVCLPAVVLWAAAAPAGEGIEAITRPSKDVTLSFDRPGRIAKVFVKDGNAVKQGQPVVQQDDAAERAKLKQLAAQADNDVRIRAAQAQLDQKEVDYKKVKEAYEKTKAASKMEVEHAKLDVMIAQLSLELSRFEHAQDKLRHEEAKILLDKMCLQSPISGRIEQVLVQKGESKDAQEPVIRIVQVDPLWIDVPAPLDRARDLKVGMSAKVRFPGGAGAEVTGKIIHIASVADAASNTIVVRVEAPNGADRPAGQHVRVSFGEPPAAKDTKTAKE